MNEGAEGDDAVDPIAALQRLGLSKYEAEVFVALQRRETGTASDVADIADVPRSQVYGAAEDLEERGLIDVQHGSPKRYRAVSLEEAREQLRRDFEREHDRAFDALRSLEYDRSGGGERQEEIWTVSGRGTIDARVARFVADAEERVRYAQPFPFDRETVDAFEAAHDDVDVVVAAVNTDLVEPFSGTGVETVVLPDAFDRNGWPRGRFLVVDGRTVLVSVVGPEGDEAAFWSEDTDFADLLIQLLDGYFGRQLDLRDGQ